MQAAIDTVQVVQLKVGETEIKDIKLGDVGYMAKRGENVVAFYLDAWTDTGRADPLGLSSSVYFTDTKETKNYPSFCFDDGAYDDGNGEDKMKFGEVYFPEFEGWSVFSVTGGKTLSICLVKD